MNSHYAPSYTRRNGNKGQALCGVYITEAEHTAEPSCPECAEALAELNAPLSAEELFGDGSDADPVYPRDFDPITGESWRLPKD